MTSSSNPTAIMSSGDSGVSLPAMPFVPWSPHQRPFYPTTWNAQPQFSPPPGGGLSPYAQAQMVYDFQMAQWAVYQQNLINHQRRSSSPGSPTPPATPPDFPDFDYFAQNVLAPGFQQESGPRPSSSNGSPSAADPRGGFHPYRRHSSSPRAESPAYLNRNDSPNSSNTSFRATSGTKSSNNEPAKLSSLSSREQPPNTKFLPPPHHRRYSSSSTLSSNSSSSHKVNSLSPPTATTTTRSNRPSPLSTTSFTAPDDIRNGKDDNPRHLLPKGLHRFGRFSASDAGDTNSFRSSATRRSSLPPEALVVSTPPTSSSFVTPPTATTTTTTTTEIEIPPASVKASRRKSLFGYKSNKSRMSTDNISLASTMSSASVMMRKMGSGFSAIGSKLHIRKTSEDLDGKRKRDSLGAITGFFGGKNKEKSTKTTAKGTMASPSISYATAELDRVDNTSTDSDGLTPAARLALQHTTENQVTESKQAEPTDKTTLSDNAPVAMEVAAASPRLILVDEEEEDVDEDDYGCDDDDLVQRDTNVTHDPSPYSSEEDDEEEEEEPDEVYEPWGQITIKLPPLPPKGILKRSKLSLKTPYASAPEILEHSALPQESSVNSNAFLTPFASTPCLSPDQVDGLQRRSSRSSRASREDSHSIKDAMRESIKPTPNPSSSSMHFSQSSLVLTQSALQKKRLTFANTLMVYDTFGRSDYDRRGEPGTWNRLTPQLAMQIREELQTYKMEEMVVHSSSVTTTSYY